MINDSNDYTMDLFIEKIVVKKRTVYDYVQMFGAVLIGIALLFILSNIQLPEFIASFRLLIIVGIFYALFRFSKTRNVEYEYAVTNGDMDIDKIIAQKKRKRLFSGHCKNYEIVAKVHSDHFNQSFASIPNKILAVSTMKDQNVYFLVSQYKGKRTIVFFEPNEKMLKSFRTYIPRKIFE